MSFLAVIIAYVISISLSGHGEPVTKWALHWHQALSDRKWNTKLCLALYALLPALVIGLILFWVGSGVLNFVVSIAVLLLAFKSGDQPESLADYQRKTEAGDDQAAWQLAVNELGLEGQMYEPGDESMDEGVQAGLAYLYLERFFVTVFWFMAFGAPGVVLVWLVSTAMHGEHIDAFCHRVKQALYWIPVRLMAFTLGLMGNFSHCFQIWLDQAKDFDRNDRVLLVTCLKSALGDVSSDEMLEHTLQLIKRSELAWLVAIALSLILGF
jgi:membrane protein required for beta-lactamase induction